MDGGDEIDEDVLAVCCVSCGVLVDEDSKREMRRRERR